MMTELTDEQRAAWRDVLADEVAGSGRARRVPRTPLIAVAAGAAVAVVVVGIGVAGRPRADPDPWQTAVPIAATGDPTLAPGQYLLVRTHAEYVGTDQDGNGYVSPEVHDEYYPADRSRLVLTRVTYGRPTVFFGPGGEAFAARDPRIPELKGEKRVDLPTLPTDPGQLLAVLGATPKPAGQQANLHLFYQLEDRLKRADLPAAQRIAACRALSLVPGIVVAGNTAVLDGARGTSFTVRSDDGVNIEQIVADPATGRYLGERLVAAKADGHVPAGTFLELTQVTVGVVDRAP